jgi:hypothetical protein
MLASGKFLQAFAVSGARILMNPFSAASGEPLALDKARRTEAKPSQTS